MPAELSFIDKIENRKILIAPLNWGLGHATRCLPLIKRLSRSNSVALASDGVALQWLTQELPKTPCHVLPGYHVSYRHKRMWLNMLLAAPGIWNTQKNELGVMDKLVKKHHYDLIISDHRFGARSDEVESVILAHQLKIPHKNLFISRAATGLHVSYLNKFDECWVPDYEVFPRLSGQLSNANIRIPKRYIGPLSRFRPCHSFEEVFDVTVVLSGPEPGRTNLEEALIRHLSTMTGMKIAFVRGTTVPLAHQLAKTVKNNMTMIDLADTEALQDIICKTSLIVARAGYSTIMDLHITGKKSILIPTPAQPEQEYLSSLHVHRNQFEILKESDISTLSLLVARVKVSK